MKFVFFSKFINRDLFSKSNVIFSPGWMGILNLKSKVHSPRPRQMCLLLSFCAEKRERWIAKKKKRRAEHKHKFVSILSRMNH